MERDDVAVLKNQIQALSANTGLKLEILRHLSRGNLSVTEIEDLVANKIKSATLYSYFRDMENARLIRVVDQESWPRKYCITSRGISEIVISVWGSTPKIRWVKGEEADWEGGRIIEDLQRELDNELTKEEAEKVKDVCFGLAKRLGLKSIYRNTARGIICETLYLMGQNSQRKEDQIRYSRLANRFLGIGRSAKDLIEYSKLDSRDGIHTRPPEELTLISFMARNLTEPLREAYLNKILYVHGLTKITHPLNINHDLRWFFLYGLHTRYLALDSPPDVRAALNMLPSIVCASQLELGGSQTLDHVNLFLAPYFEDLMNATDMSFTTNIEDLLLELWQLYATRPKEPVFSTLVLDLFRSDPHIGEVVRSGEVLGSSYHKFNNSCSSIPAEKIIQSYDRLLALTKGMLCYPRIYLRIDKKWLEELEANVLRNLVKIITGSTTSVPLYFVNMDHRINREGHVAYFSEVQRTSYPFDDQCHRKGIGTFVSLNFPGMLKFKSNGGLDPFRTVIEETKKLAQELVEFHKTKIDALKDMQMSGKLDILGMRNPSGKPYMCLDRSYVNLGLCGLSSFMKLCGKDFRQNFGELENLLSDVTTDLRQLSTKEVSVQLSQTPQRSGAFLHFINQPTVPYDYANLAPYDDSDQDQHEARLHEILSGGAVSRLYIQRRKLAEMIDDPTAISKILENGINNHFSLFQIVPGSKPVL